MFCCSRTLTSKRLFGKGNERESRKDEEGKGTAVHKKEWKKERRERKRKKQEGIEAS